jgi:hypothetical protein
MPSAHKIQKALYDKKKTSAHLLLGLVESHGMLLVTHCADFGPKNHTRKNVSVTLVLAGAADRRWALYARKQRPSTRSLR